MTHPLLARLDRIGESLSRREGVLALLGVGSCGTETHRLDDWSDLDFFVVVEPGAKARFIDALDWLSDAHPLAWHFRNTADGHKALMADGVFCEFAVFEPQELNQVPQLSARAVWKRGDVGDDIVQYGKAPTPPSSQGETWIVGEALSCLLVGLLRWHRGERMSAARFVQSYALDRLIELDALRHAPPAGDLFSVDRRIEKRQPELAALLPQLVPGYLHTPSAALAMLDALAARSAVLDPTAEAMVRRLAQT
jgi:hypothetical protein